MWSCEIMVPTMVRPSVVMMQTFPTRRSSYIRPSERVVSLPGGEGWGGTDEEAAGETHCSGSC